MPSVSGVTAAVICAYDITSGPRLWPVETTVDFPMAIFFFTYSVSTGMNFIDLALGPTGRAKNVDLKKLLSLRGTYAK